MKLDPAFALLLGALIALVASVVTTLLSNQAALGRERLRAHEDRRHTAYSNLFKFAHRLRTRIFPLAEHKQQELHEAIEKLFDTLDFTYYSDRVTEILDELYEAYTCETHPDLRTEGLVAEEFYEKKLLKLVEELHQQARKGMRVRV